MVTLLEEHRTGCGALREVASGRWDNPWSGVPQDYDAHDDDPLLTVTFRCNDPDCPAKVAIDSKKLAKFVTEEITTGLDPDG